MTETQNNPNCVLLGIYPITCSSHRLLLRFFMRNDPASEGGFPNCSVLFCLAVLLPHTRKERGKAVADKDGANLRIERRVKAIQVSSRRRA